MQKHPEKLDKTIVIGCKGYLGSAFFESYKQFHPDTLGTHYRDKDSSRKLDLSAPNLIPLQLNPNEYKYAIITASNTDLSLCELHKNEKYRENVEGVLELVHSLVKAKIQPIIFSSAYVFDGKIGDYNENAERNPINEYGHQKKILEESIEKICGSNYLILRCGKVFDLNKGSQTLLDQMFASLSKNEKIFAAYDQIFAPLLLDDLVSTVIQLQKKGLTGLYNICGPEVISRYDLALKIAHSMDISPQLIHPISLDELKNPFKLPKRMNLNCNKLQNGVNLTLTSLSTCIEKLKKQYLCEAQNVLPI